jgi:hypothetical protein
MITPSNLVFALGCAFGYDWDYVYPYEWWMEDLFPDWTQKSLGSLFYSSSISWHVVKYNRQHTCFAH